MKKRGQGLSTNAIVLIILAVVVLVVLAIGFTMGWNKLAPWLSSSGNNVDTIAQQCAVACTTSAESDFCDVERTLNDGTNEVVGTCDVLSTKGLGIDSCGSFTCPMYNYEWVANLKACTDKASGKVVSVASGLCTSEQLEGKSCCRTPKA